MLTLIQSPSSRNEIATALPPVVIIHGIFRDHRLMKHLRQAFTLAGRRVLTPDLTPNDGSAGINELALQIGEYLEANLGPDERCDLIGHSMGAMVARSYVQRHGGRRRVRKLVTLAAPHHGTVLAWLHRGRGARDLRPGSAFLRDLARDEHRLEGVHVASYWTPFDAIIVPPRSSELSVGENRRRLLPHHRAFVESPRLARELVELLGA
jgi:triacylglycerol lipase